MLPLEVNERNRIRLECGVPVDAREHMNLSVGAFLEQGRKMHGIRRPPINRQGGRVEALELGHVVFRANDAFDGRCMPVCEGMAVIGGEEMMRNSTMGEALRREKMPHPLAEARLEVMRTTIRPDIDAVEMIDELLEMEEGEPNVEDEMIIIFVCFRTVAKEVDVLPHAMTGRGNIFQHDDAILHDGVITLVSDFRSEEDGSEIH